MINKVGVVMNIKERRNETKAYDLVILAADLGFTPVKVSSRFMDRLH